MLTSRTRFKTSTISWFPWSLKMQQPSGKEWQTLCHDILTAKKKPIACHGWGNKGSTNAIFSTWICLLSISWYILIKPPLNLNLQYIIKLLVVTLPHRVTSIYRSTAKGPEWCNKALLPANTWVDLQISKDTPRDIPSTPHISPGEGQGVSRVGNVVYMCTSSSCKINQINQIVSSSLHLEVERTILGRGRFGL